MVQTTDEHAETPTLTVDKNTKQLQQLQISMLEQLHQMQINTLKQLRQLQTDNDETIAPTADRYAETIKTTTVKHAKIITPTADKYVEPTPPPAVKYVEPIPPPAVKYAELPPLPADKYVEPTPPPAVRYAEPTPPPAVRYAEPTPLPAAKHAEPTAPAIANPAPLGLCAFALTTFVLSAHNIGLFEKGGVVIGLALFYGGLAQLLAGMWEFRLNNTFGALAFTSYGAFWLATGWALQNNQLGDGFGYVLTAWTIFTFIGFLGTLKTNLALISVFFFLTMTFVVLTIGAFTHIGSWTQIGGWLGMVTAVLAWYTAAAGLLSSIKGAFTLPTFPVN